VCCNTEQRLTQERDNAWWRLGGLSGSAQVFDTIKKPKPENKYRKEKRNQKWKKLLRIRREKDSKRRRRK
jgi:hypothetical protein